MIGFAEGGVRSASRCKINDMMYSAAKYQDRAKQQMEEKKKVKTAEEESRNHVTQRRSLLLLLHHYLLIRPPTFSVGSWQNRGETSKAERNAKRWTGSAPSLLSAHLGPSCHVVTGVLLALSIFTEWISHLCHALDWLRALNNRRPVHHASSCTRPSPDTVTHRAWILVSRPLLAQHRVLALYLGLVAGLARERRRVQDGGHPGVMQGREGLFGLASTSTKTTFLPCLLPHTQHTGHITTQGTGDKTTLIVLKA